MLLWTGFCEVITCVELYSQRSVCLLSFNLMPWDPSTMLCDSVAFGSCGRVIPPLASSSVQIADRFLAPTRKAVVNFQVRIFAWMCITISPGTTRGGVAEWWAGMWERLEKLKSASKAAFPSTILISKISSCSSSSLTFGFLTLQYQWFQWWDSK